MQVDATKMQVDTTKIQVDATKMQVDATKMQVDATKMRVDALKVQRLRSWTKIIYRYSQRSITQVHNTTYGSGYFFDNRYKITIKVLLDITISVLNRSKFSELWKAICHLDGNE